MVTNHGIHEFVLQAGLPDTGGQNVFVNEMSRAMVDAGWRVTIVNRGGYPHPVTREIRSGVIYDGPYLRIKLIEDGTGRFVTKERMADHVERLAENVARFVFEQGLPDIVVSHYWDGGLVAARAIEILSSRPGRKPVHAWIPHSLGAVKRRNIAPEIWKDLGLDQREELERAVLRSVDIVGSTSGTIERSLQRDYGYDGTPVFIPPCVDTKRFFPGDGAVEPAVADRLSRSSGWQPGSILTSRIITEVSRTDRTKRKDIVLRVFAGIAARYPDTFLALTLDLNQGTVADELVRLIELLGIRSRVAVLGNVQDILPGLYRSSYLYITPSEVEGFGMSIQEAAACSVPAVSSDRVPFATEYLETGGAIIVPHGRIDGFSEAVAKLLEDRSLRNTMGSTALKITVPRFTWSVKTAEFLDTVLGSR